MKEIGEPLPDERRCDHKYNWLRQEERNIGYDRDPLWLIQDVYACEKCLQYKRVDIRKERPGRDDFGRRVVENLV